MKVLLLEPLVPSEEKWGSFSAAKGYLPPMGMVALYSYLKREGVTVVFVDTQFGDFGEPELRRLLATDREIGLVGIPVFTNSAVHSFRTAAVCRSANEQLRIVLGGVHATGLPERTLQECPEADFVVIGEGERTLRELVGALEGGKPIERVDGIAYRAGGTVRRTTPRAFIQNLDELPMPAYEDIDLSRYVPHPTQYRVLPNYPMVTQRGCPYNCTFCEASLAQGKRVRRYSPDRILDEMRLLVERFGARSIYFQDSTFTLSREHTVDLLEKIVRSRLRVQWACNTRCDRVDDGLLALMKRAGCWMISYGIESANQQSLDILRKGFTVDQAERAVTLTKKHGIATLCSFILAIPGEDEAMSEKTIALARRMLPDVALFYLPVPYPSTELCRTCRDRGGLREDVTWSDYLAVDFRNPVYVNPLIGAERMRLLYRRAFREFYTDPRYLFARLAGLRSWSEIQRSIRGVRAILPVLSRRTRPVVGEPEQTNG